MGKYHCIQLSIQSHPKLASAHERAPPEGPRGLPGAAAVHALLYTLRHHVHRLSGLQ